MNVFSISRRIARKVAAQVDLLERMRQELFAAIARLLQPSGRLSPDQSCHCSARTSAPT